MLLLVAVAHLSELKTLTIEGGSLFLRLNYGGRCAIDRLVVNGRVVALAPDGIHSGIKVAGKWYTTAGAVPEPTVERLANQVTVKDIRIGGSGVRVSEDWTFTTAKADIEWSIHRRYLSGGVVEDTACPRFAFADMTTWTGALLGTGGVAWCKLFDAPNATYGIHTSKATLWNPKVDTCLELKARRDGPVAVSFSRQTDGSFTMSSQPTAEELTPAHGLARFLRDSQDVWAPFTVKQGQTETVTYSLRGMSYEKAFGRGSLKRLDGHAVGEILNTIGRVGVIDEKIMGSNGWYSGYAVLHEPWIALMGLAVNDETFTRNMSDTLAYQAKYAVQKDGMVKSRWAYGPYDSIPGTYDREGFYECQWGRLMDTQPSFVINVANQFDMNGDLAWVRSLKEPCERALDYLLKRDSNGNGLVEMETDSRNQHKSSDWLDVVWASHESAFVNAQMYRALTQWAEIEAVLGDKLKAADFAAKAAKLKASFNLPVAEGGFWDPQNKWYVYWRDKDGSVHGNNLTLPVNFMAIGYGLCDDLVRRAAILDRTEEEMAKEKLFCWPINLFTFAPDETSNVPLPTYENGDIFLAWAELGIRSYAAYKPEIAVKYLRNVLDQYNKDGLAFQRYLRGPQTGVGDDILANNCMAVVGLYRDVYGIRPKHNRLYLEPHLTAELYGTVMRYDLRGRNLTISLGNSLQTVESEGKSLSGRGPFGVAFHRDTVAFFQGEEASPALSIRSKRDLTVRIETWESSMKWTLAGKAGVASCTLPGMKLGRLYMVEIDGDKRVTGASHSGALAFDVPLKGGQQEIEVTPL